MAKLPLVQGRIAPDDAAKLIVASGLSTGAYLRSLIDEAKRFARPTLSNYHVGAVGLGASGAIYLGANVEFPASQLAQTIHAEQALIANAMQHGESAITDIAISAAPCGSCRQFLYELAAADSLQIWLNGGTPHRLSEFLPDAFGPRDLGIEGGLLAPIDHQLVLANGATTLEKNVITALAAVNQSYAPYTRAWASCAVTLAGGDVFAGSYAENAAFNPSLAPMQAAIVALILAERHWSEIEDVVTIQGAESNIDHVQGARRLLDSLRVKASIRCLNY